MDDPIDLGSNDDLTATRDGGGGDRQQQHQQRSGARKSG
jgi:hypothetical protein